MGILLAIILLLSGCKQFPSRWDNPGGSRLPDYSHPDLNDLLEFGSNMASISPSARANVCRTLTRQHASRVITAKLYLLAGRLYSNSCGDISQVLKTVGSIRRTDIYDERIWNLITIQTEALKRMQYSNMNATPVFSDRRPGAVVSSPERKSENTPTKDETLLLRRKLEALRSIEKQMDESGDLN
jgi:hypothetical protein